MEKFELLLSIFVIVGTIIGTIVSSTVSESELLKPKPHFTAEIDSLINNFTNGEKVVVSNIGNSQAKNSVIIIEGFEPLKISKDSCPEGKIILETESTIKINLEKFSTNIQCVIEFNDSPKHNINTLIVTGDDADGYQHEFKKEDEKPIGISPYLQFPIEFFIILISYASAGFSFLYLLGKRIQRKKTLELYKQKEQQLLLLQENIRQKLESEKSKTREIDSKKFIKQIDLAEKLIQNNNEIDAAKIIQNYPSTVTLTNEFFEKWSSLEKILLSLGTTIQSRIDHLKPLNVLLELKNKELISLELFSNLNTLVNYRNSLVHGATKLETSELRNNIKLLNESIGKLLKIQPSAEYTISIPPGTSVPGCEKNNECYMPFELKIKEGQIVTWINDDSAAHTVTSGSAADGPSGLFDSGLIMGGQSFSWKSKKKGEHVYHCMVHPWQHGIIVVD